MGSSASPSSRAFTGLDVMAMAEAARWAPSIHNTQPWALRVEPDGLAVYEDPTRAVPFIDPRGRERVISCGAAVLNAVVELQAQGFAAGFVLGADPADETLVGRVRPGVPVPTTAETMALRAAITSRRTHRRVYRSHVVAEADLLALREAATSPGARLEIAGLKSRRELAHLMMQALTAQLASPEVRRETDSWLRSSASGASGAAASPLGSAGGVVDGIPVQSMGNFPFPVDSLAHAGHQGAADVGLLEEELARGTVLVISTRGDSRPDWIIAGMAMERLLLVATARGLVASFAEQALQHEATRHQVARTLGLWGHPQLLLRIGRPLVDAPITPRRPLADLIRS